ncbi:putative TLC domain-containing protein C17A2.02c [Grifola frondosa]|uniref:Putative TLC domain-containing protein C17A2.02c n=1 Tax=Grifola frondosa TaxID=5627 RepID=A0A1C7MJR9_GRIFR|nr:putative TLC domain-containing protein C17A2.02c [Grifola frondosa]
MELPLRASLEELARPLAYELNLPHLPPYFPTLVYAFASFLAIHLVISPTLSARYFPQSYGRLKSRRAVNNWNIQVVSLFHVFIVVPLAARCLRSPTLSADKAFGWDDRVGTTIAVACGYFLWDCVDGIINFDDFGFLVHGDFADLTDNLVMFVPSRFIVPGRIWTGVCSFDEAIPGILCMPILIMGAVRALSFSTSTGENAQKLITVAAMLISIGENDRFLDKTGRTGSTLQYVNGVFLLLTFFCARIVYGWYMTLGFWQTLYGVRGTVPSAYLLVYFVGNLALNTLNVIWLYKMVFALRKRFEVDVKPALQQKANGNGKAH